MAQKQTFFMGNQISVVVYIVMFALENNAFKVVYGKNVATIERPPKHWSECAGVLRIAEPTGRASHQD